MNGIKEWFPLYASDWLTSIGLRLCSPFSRGILIDLMAYSWQNGTPGIIKDKPGDLSVFFHCTEEEFSNATAELEQRGRIRRDDGNIIIPRLHEVAREQQEKHERRAGAGRLGGLAKAQKQGLNDQDSSNATANSSNALAVDKKRRDKIRKEQNKYPDNSDELQLSKLLYELMLKNDPKTKQPNYQKWAIHIDRLMRIDGRTSQEIERVIRWCQNDSFWISNIRSTDKLRKQFSQLWLKMKNKPGAKRLESERAGKVWPDGSQ
jgi:hypothetical protein